MSSISARAITRKPSHHSFGYYDKSPWDASGRYLLALAAPFCDRSPGADDVAVLGVVDLFNDARFQPFAETRAWNWQQGCMLQWLPSSSQRLVIYNERDGDRFVSVIQDALDGRVVRRLPLPIYAISHDGTQGLALNFSRLHHQRPGYGYAGVPDPWRTVLEPEDDGIYSMDLASGQHRLILPVSEMAHMQRRPQMDGAVHRFNHLQFSPDDAHFIFLHRWRLPAPARVSPRRRIVGGLRGLRRIMWHDEELAGLSLTDRAMFAVRGLGRVLGSRYGTDVPGLSRLCTARADGSNVRILADEGMVSHFDWADSEHVLAWARHQGRDAFFLFDQRTGEAVAVGPDSMTRDGHCSYSPDSDRRWILNDTLPDVHNYRDLYVYDTRAQRRVELGRFYSPPALANDFRCDLHPRWSRDGRQICIDSVHEGTRQLYIVDVSTATALSD